MQSYFCAMRQEHVDVIMNILICKGRTKNGKVDYRTSTPVKETDNDKL